MNFLGRSFSDQVAASFVDLKIPHRVVRRSMTSRVQRCNWKIAGTRYSRLDSNIVLLRRSIRIARAPCTVPYPQHHHVSYRNFSSSSGIPPPPSSTRGSVSGREPSFRISSQVASFTLMLVPVVVVLGYAAAFAPSQEQLEAELRQKYPQEIQEATQRSKVMAEMVQNVIQRKNDHTESGKQVDAKLQEVLMGGVGQQKRIYALDEKLLGKPGEGALASNLVTNTSKKEEKEGPTTVVLNNAAVAVDMAQQQRQPLETEPTNNKQEKKQKKRKRSLNDMVLPLEVTLQTKEPMKTSTSATAQVLTITTAVALAGIVGYLLGNRRSS